MVSRLLRSLAIAACLSCSGAAAQDLGPLLPTGPSPLRSPLLDRYTLPGEAPGKLARAKVSSALAGMDRPEPQLRLRGAREIELYRTMAPAVALILADKAGGSASLIAVKGADGSPSKSGMLLTNAHVVGDAGEVAVMFKPQHDGGKVNPADAVVGRVRKVDPVRDLALVEVASVPANAAVMKLGTMKDVQVGADVHAIGHPQGQAWTYTKGLVSQIRPGYQWQPDPAGPRHVADVIQTQTPINPGNSGGPLIDDGGRLIGVNSFKAEGEGLNFAVSVAEVEKFLTAAQGGAYEPKVAAATRRIPAPSRSCMKDAAKQTTRSSGTSTSTAAAGRMPCSMFPTTNPSRSSFASTPTTTERSTPKSTTRTAMTSGTIPCGTPTSTASRTSSAIIPTASSNRRAMRSTGRNPDEPKS